MEHTEKMEKLANEIIKFLEKKELFIDTSIYVNNKRMMSDGTIEDDINVTKYLEYCNPETLSMTFEGPLYRELNGYGKNNKVYEQLDKIAGKYGYYIQPGYAWSLTLYN